VARWIGDAPSLGGGQALPVAGAAGPFLVRFLISTVVSGKRPELSLGHPDIVAELVCAVSLNFAI
jgi:hypothetical protein